MFVTSWIRVSAAVEEAERVVKGRALVRVARRRVLRASILVVGGDNLESWNGSKVGEKEG